MTITFACPWSDNMRVRPCSLLDFKQMKLVTDLLIAGELLHDPARRSLPLNAPAAAVAAARQQEAAPPPASLAAAAVALTGRVSQLYAAACSGDVPSVGPAHAGGAHAGCLPAADVVDALADRLISLLMVCHALHGTMELLAATELAAKQTPSEAKQTQPAAQQTKAAARQTQSAAKQTRSAAEQTRSAAQTAAKHSSTPVSGRQAEQAQPDVQRSQPTAGQANDRPCSRPRMRLPRADAAAAVQVVLRLAALAAEPRPPPGALLALSRAAIGLLSMALKVGQAPLCPRSSLLSYLQSIPGRIIRLSAVMGKKEHNLMFTRWFGQLGNVLRAASMFQQMQC